jgi:hypothetical protein
MARRPPTPRDYLRMLPIALLGTLPVPLILGAVTGHIRVFAVGALIFGFVGWLFAIALSRWDWRRHGRTHPRPPIDSQRERLYRFIRRNGLALVPFYCLVGVVFGIAFGLVAGVITGLIAISLGLYQIFAFRHVNEWLHRRKSA